MNNTFTIESLTRWVESVKDFAKQDTPVSIVWFKETENMPFSIVAGWQKMFTKSDCSDLFCCSKSQPEYVMCVKIAANEGPYAYADFEYMTMPVDKNGVLDDTCMPLEWEDPAEVVAMFFLMEWERIMKEHEEGI